MVYSMDGSSGRAGETALAEEVEAEGAGGSELLMDQREGESWVMLARDW